MLEKTLTRYLSTAKIFDWRRVIPQITHNDVIKIFRYEGLLIKQRYRTMEDQKPGPGLACSLDFAKGEGVIEPKVKTISKVV